MNTSIANPDHAAELGLVGAVFTVGLRGLHDASEVVRPSDFSEVRASAAWRVLLQMDEKGTEISESSFLHFARAHGAPDDIGDLPTFVADCLEFSDTVSITAPVVVENAKRRRALLVASQLIAKCKDRSQPIDDILAQTESLLAGEQVHSSTILDGKAFVRATIDDVERRHGMQGKFTGVETGFNRFDRLTSGLQFGELSIVAARPSVGKTAFACNVIEHAVIQGGVPSLFITLEMTPASLGRRIASSFCRIPMGDLRDGTLTEGQMRSLTNYTSRISKSPIHVVYPESPDVNRVCAMIRRTVRNHGIRLVVIDYLGKLRGSGRHEKKTYEVGEVTGELKKCAVTTNAAFLVLSQLNRESEKQRKGNDNKPVRPRLVELADSAKIEQDADLIGLLFRDRADDSVQPELIIAKQREGELDTIDLDFDGRHCRFTESNPRPGDAENEA